MSKDNERAVSEMKALADSFEKEVTLSHFVAAHNSTSLKQRLQAKHQFSCGGVTLTVCAACC